MPWASSPQVAACCLGLRDWGLGLDKTYPIIAKAKLFEAKSAQAKNFTPTVGQERCSWDPAMLSPNPPGVPSMRNDPDHLLNFKGFRLMPPTLLSGICPCQTIKCCQNLVLVRFWGSRGPAVSRFGAGLSGCGAQCENLCSNKGPN